MLSFPSSRQARGPLRQARGFTLVELMIATAIGLIILAGMATLFVSNSKTQAEIEKANRQVENGRYGVQLLSTDLTNAGFYGEFDPSVLPTPAALPDVCATGLAEIRAALPLHVQGFDQPDAALAPCLTDRKTGTDVLVVRRTQTCVAGMGNCLAVTGGGVFMQASLCSNATELGSAEPEDHYDLDSATANLTRHARDCSTDPGTGTAAVVRRYLVNIYYVANNSEAGDGIPTLKRAELGGAGGALAFNVVSLVEGIENLQIEYGVGGGVFNAEPPSPADWRLVTTVKLHLLARNLEETIDYVDEKTYKLGVNADGTSNVVAATRDHYKRHVFQSQVVLRNPAGRM